MAASVASFKPNSVRPRTTLMMAMRLSASTASMTRSNSVFSSPLRRRLAGAGAHEVRPPTPRRRARTLLQFARASSDASRSCASKQHEKSTRQSRRSFGSRAYARSFVHACASRALNPLEPSASGFSPPSRRRRHRPHARRDARRDRAGRGNDVVYAQTLVPRVLAVVIARRRASSRAQSSIRPSYRRRAGVHPCTRRIPRRRDDRAKDGVRERTHRERLHLFDDSVRLRRGEDDGAARGGSRTRGGGLRARGFARARRRSVSRSIRLSVVHRRARARKTRGGDEENIHRATSARPRVDRVARRVARTSRHAARARSGSRARRRPFAARVTLAANARGRSRARARERESSKMDAPWRPC